MSRPVTCQACGETWARDPILEVECPDCRVGPGVFCRRPSGHKASSYHASRDHAAIAAGAYGICPAGPSAAAAPQPTLF